MNKLYNNSNANQNIEWISMKIEFTFLIRTIVLMTSNQNK